VALAGTTLVGPAAGQEGRSYEVVSQAVTPVSQVSLQDGIAHTSNRQGMVVIDFSAPLAAVPAQGNADDGVTGRASRCWS